MKKLTFGLILIGLTVVGYFGYQYFFSKKFHIAGSITLDPSLEYRAKRPNTVLFLVAKNTAGIPVAVKRMINPQFPLNFEMGPEDLILPGYTWTGPLQIEVLVNNHGHAGVVLTGDLAGFYPTIVASGNESISITIDKILNKVNPRS